MGPVPAEVGDAYALRKEIRSFLGVHPSTRSPEVRALATWQDEGYVRHLVHLLTDDEAIPAFLAVPAGATRDAPIVAWERRDRSGTIGARSVPVGVRTDHPEPIGCGQGDQASSCCWTASARSSPAAARRSSSRRARAVGSPGGALESTAWSHAITYCDDRRIHSMLSPKTVRMKWIARWLASPSVRPTKTIARSATCGVPW